MRSRGLVVAIAVVLAVAAAAAVVLYVQGVKEDAIQGGELQPVIVAMQEIPANQRLDPLIDQGGIFDEVQIPESALVDGAVTSLDQLRGQTTVTPILANEQISVSRLSSGEGELNLVGVSKGHIGVTFEFEAPRGGAGNIHPGDHVAVFATYQNSEILTGPTTQQALNNRVPTTLQQKKIEAPDFTATLIPTVRVLTIENPSVDSETGEVSDSDRIRVTLDLLPEDAQAIVFAQEAGLVWLGLLSPDDAESGLGQPEAAQVPIELILGRRSG
jgi:Flp pilus assembly protein CpaB